MGTVIFSRKGGASGRHARGDDAQRGPEPADEAAAGPEPVLRGPYDVQDAPAGVARLDLGSLQIPAVEGVEVRVQANPDGGVQQVVLVHGGSALQLGVFAAPRTEGIWDEVRADIATELADKGALTVQELAGEYGTELAARVRNPDGSTTDLRFVGVDGPRWMLRALYQGPAATDPAAAARLAECLAGVVVDRGGEAKPVREQLPLRLPRELTPQAEEGGPAAGAGQSTGAGPTAPATNGVDPTDGAARRRPSPRPRGTA